MKYYLVAGEASGDLHGANLMKALKQLDSQAEFRFWGGDLMQAEGGTLVNHYKERAFMGITEVLVNIRKIMGFMKQCKQDILDWKPDALILIDYPGFNMKIAPFAKEHGIPVHYYISPKVWAWNTKRVEKIKLYVDHLYAILPFEVDFYREHKYKIDYVGNPLMDAIAAYSFQPDFKSKHQVTKPVIALLPGSRRQEITNMLPVMLSVVDAFPQYEFVVASSNSLPSELYDQYIGDRQIKRITGETYDLLANAHAALVCSGTATLETALLKCPQVVCYKFSRISYTIGKMVVKIKFISLVNLIMDKPLVKELIQYGFTTETATEELKRITEAGSYRNDMLTGYAALKIKVGPPGASQRTAELIYQRTKGKV